MAVDKSLKDLASAILKKNGIDHDKWLTEKYTELIIGNASILKAGIEDNEQIKNSNCNNNSSYNNALNKESDSISSTQNN